MKKQLLLTLLTLLSLMIVTQGCATAPKPVSPGSFEQDPFGGKSQYDWYPTILPDTQEFVHFNWDDQIFHSGQHSASIAIDPSHPDDKIFYNWTRVVPECQIGKSYTLTGWIKSENLGGVTSLLVQCWDGNNEMLEFASTQGHHPIGTTTDWTEVGTVFTVPEGTDHVRIRAGLSNPENRGGQVWFDDIQVSETKTDSLDIMQGMWSGALDAGVKLRLILRVEHSKWLVTLDSIDQGANGLIVSNLVVDGDQVSFELKRLRASFSGTMIDSDHIEGTWKQGVELPLAFERIVEEPVVLRPQEPQEPFPYTIEEVEYTFDPDNIQKTLHSETVKSASPMITLRGTLTLPPGEGPHPCVLLISGSGAQDRNETLMNHQPFWVLADHLSRHGLAVLRVDDRGTAKSTGSFARSTTQDFAKDAEAGFLFLQGRSDIDRVALMGHSEGGLIAPMVAANNPDVAAIVLMAGPGVDGREVLRLQGRLMLKAQGFSDEQVETSLANQEKGFEILCGGFEAEEFDQRIDKYLTESYESLTGDEKKESGSQEDFNKVARAQLTNPWMRWFLNYDPAPTLRQVSCPVLAVNGSKDLQVDANQNLPAIAAALEAGGAEDFQTVELPDLNHLFQHCDTGAISEYGMIEETLAPEFLELVTQWLQQKLGSSKSLYR